MSNFKKQLLAGPYLIWMIGFILLPLVFILYYAITAADGSFTFSNIAAIADPVHVKSILLSLKLGFLCTLFCLVLSYPLCMILSTFRFRHQSFVVFLFILPMWMNFMLRILAWRPLLSNNGIVNAILEAVGNRPCGDAQHPDRRCVRHDVRFSSFYDPADLQLHGADQQGRHRSRQGSRREQSDRSRKNHFSAHPSPAC